MEANVVILAPLINEGDMPFGANEEQILTAAKTYKIILEKAKTLVYQAPDNLLSGSPSTVYMKKMGHNVLTTDDSESIINELGTPHEKEAILLFHQAQQAISERLQNTKNIGLLLQQAEVPYDQVYKRAKRTYLWKPDQMIQIMEVLRRLQL